MIARLFASILALTLAIPAAANDDIRTEVVKFKKDTTSTVTSGETTGRGSVVYKLNARKGQFLQVRLVPNKQSVDDNIDLLGRGPGEEALYTSATGGRKFLGQLYKTGGHSISIFLHRNAARRRLTTTYQLHLSQHILEPLALDDTGFRTGGGTSDFTTYATGVSPDPVAMSPSFAWCAGAAVTTARDLADFLDRALQGKLFKKDATLSFWIEEGFRPLMGLDFLPSYGHGLMRKTIGELEIFGHDGQTFGATALVARCDKLGATLVLSRNDSQQSNMWATAVSVLATLKEAIESRDDDGAEN